MTELRVALIGGAGQMGKAHSLVYDMLGIAAHPSAKIRKHLLADVDPDRAAAAAAALGWAESTGDWKAAVARDDVDIVDIVTPPDSHAEIALEAIAHGKHVFVEKPIANSAEEAEAMWTAARAAGVTGQVGFNYRHTPAISYAKQILDSGRLGTPLQIRIQYHMDAGFAKPLGWRRRRDTGASGASGDLGSHVIDMAEYLLGPVASVSSRLAANADQLDASGAFIADKNIESDYDVDDSGVSVLEFASGAVGSLSFGLTSVEKKNQIKWELDCSDGTIVFDWNHRDELHVGLRDATSPEAGLTRIMMGPHHPDGMWDIAGFGSGYLEPGTIQIKKFIDGILGLGDARPNFSDAAHVQRVVEAIVESDRERRWVDVPPALA